MATTLKTVYTNGIFRPLEDFDFPEGKELTITIDDPPIAYRPGEGLEEAAGEWKGLVDGEQLKKAILDSRQIRPRSEVKF